LLSKEARNEWKQHWRVVVGGGAGMTLLAVPTYTNGVMVIPLEKAFGWTRAEIASGPVIAAILSVFMGPLIGILVDRFGPRRIGVAGALNMCLAVALLSQTNGSLWSWWAVWLLVALGAIFIKPMVWTSGVASFFDKARGLAMAAALCGTAVCSTLTPLLATSLYERFGWQLTYVGLALFWGIVLLPLIFFMFDSRQDKVRRERLLTAKEAKAPLETAAAADGPAEGRDIEKEHVAASQAPSPKELFFSLKYARLVLAALTMVFSTVSFVILLVPILVEIEIEFSEAAAMASLVGIMTVLGRLGGGMLLDRYNGNYVTAGAILLPAASAVLILILPGSIVAVLVAIILLGLASGAEYDGVAYLITRHFGLKSFGLLFGTIGGLQAMGSGLGPMIVNHIYDTTNSYNLALYLFIPISIVGAILFSTLGPYQDSEFEK